MNNEIDILQQIGQRILSRRKAMALSQDQLAYTAGIDRTTVGYIENGKQNVSISMLCKIATALQIDIKDLFI